MEKKKVEFIESYVKVGNSDYIWSDNHGELIRCRDCKYGVQSSEHDVFCNRSHYFNKYKEPDWYCADAERR